MADRIGSGQSNLVTSVNGNPNLSTLQEIAEVLAIPVSELLTQRPESAVGLVIIGGQTYQLSMSPATFRSRALLTLIFYLYNYFEITLGDFNTCCVYIVN